MKRENVLLLNWLQLKYVELKKYILHVKLTVYYTVSFTCNINFLNSTYILFSIKLKVTSFRISFAAGYMCVLKQWLTIGSSDIMQVWDGSRLGSFSRRDDSNEGPQHSIFEK